MVSSLILDSLETKQFRVFERLQIEHLGRVNLIVGENNVGKSCLLEALWLYARRGSPELILQLLMARDESSGLSLRRSRMDLEDEISTIKYLFHGRRSIQDESKSIQIGPLGSQNGRLAITVGGYTVQVDEQGGRELLQQIFAGFTIIGVLPGANGPGKPDIYMAKLVSR